VRLSSGAPIKWRSHFAKQFQQDVKKFESSLANVRRFVYGGDRHHVPTTMQMPINTPTYLGEAAVAASWFCAHAPAVDELRTDNAPALAERSAT
jgi:hypothetical protein